MNTHQLPPAYVSPTMGTPIPSPPLSTHVLTLHLWLLTLPKHPSPVHSPSVLNTAHNSHRPYAHAHGRHGGLCAHCALMLRSPLYPEQGGQIHLTVRRGTESYQVKQFIGRSLKADLLPNSIGPGGKDKAGSGQQRRDSHIGVFTWASNARRTLSSGP